MKKGFLIIMALLLLALAACGSPAAPAATETPAETPTVSAAAAAKMLTVGSMDIELPAGWTYTLADGVYTLDSGDGNFGGTIRSADTRISDLATLTEGDVKEQYEKQLAASDRAVSVTVSEFAHIEKDGMEGVSYIVRIPEDAAARDIIQYMFTGEYGTYYITLSQPNGGIGMALLKSVAETIAFHPKDTSLSSGTYENGVLKCAHLSLTPPAGWVAKESDSGIIRLSSPAEGATAAIVIRCSEAADTAFDTYSADYYKAKMEETLTAAYPDVETAVSVLSYEETELDGAPGKRVELECVIDGNKLHQIQTIFTSEAIGSVAVSTTAAAGDPLDAEMLAALGTLRLF